MGEREESKRKHRKERAGHRLEQLLRGHFWVFGVSTLCQSQIKGVEDVLKCVISVFAVANYCKNLKLKNIKRV